jgi:hypothetical protein
MSIVAAGLVFVCTPVAVWDGDGPIWCAPGPGEKSGPRLRIAGIAARERDGSCRPHHPCPRASALESRDALVKLLGGSTGTFRAHPNAAYEHVRVAGPPLRCVSDGDARGTRTAARCELPATATRPARDLGCAMLATRTVKKWKAFWRGRGCR